MGKKDRLAILLNAIKVLPLLGNMRTWMRNDLKIIAYHRIDDTDPLNDPELVSASCSEFENHISFIKENYNPITLSEVANAIENGKILPTNSLVITFDDGFADNYHNAFPILAKHNVPATFFVSSDYVESSDTFWFNQISRLIRNNRNCKFSVLGKDYHILNSNQQNDQLIEELLGNFKRVKNKRRLDALEQINKQLTDSDSFRDMVIPVTWSQLKEMQKGGMEIASHSATHPILSQLDATELEHEIIKSKTKLEKGLTVEVSTISYPEGMDYAYNQDVLELVERAGYKLGCSYKPGINLYSDLEKFQLRRLHIERYTGFERFKAMLALPEVFA